MSFTPDLTKGNTIKTFGNSMAPIFVNNDILYYKKVAFNNIKTNDIVIVKKANTYFTHRVIYRSEEFIVTKGDNNPNNDGKIYPKQIIGRVYRIKRKKNYFAPEDLYRTQSMFYFNEIKGVTHVLTRSNIPFLFLKGLPLYLFYTNSNPQRLYSDCDILVKPADFPKVQELLEKAGYFHIETTPVKYSRDGIRPEYAFYKKIYGFPVIFDVHTEPVFLMAKIPTENLYPSALISAMTEDYLTNHRVITIEKKEYPMLSVKHLIVYLALHFFHHNYRGAYRLSLLHLVIHEELKKIHKKDVAAFWEDISEYIADYSLQNIVYPCFFFLKKYYQTPIPENFFTGIQPMGVTKWYIQKKVLTIDPFTEQTTIESGIERFESILLLTKSSFYRKVLGITDLRVLALAIDVIRGRMIHVWRRWQRDIGLIKV